MRIVSSNSREWKTPGIGGTEIATLFGVSVESETPLVLWAKKIEQRRKHAEKEAGLKKVPDSALPQGSPEWLEWRRKGVGGSEVSVLTGDSPWGSVEELWKSKVGEIGEKAENANMRRGKQLEPEARRLYQGLMGWNSPPLCVLHDEQDFMRCSLDGLRADERVVLEIKAPLLKGHLKTAAVLESGNPQACFAELIGYYYCQIQYQLLITGAPLCHFVSYCEDQAAPAKFLLCPIREDKAKQAAIERRVRWFWDFVLRNTPPTGNPP